MNSCHIFNIDNTLIDFDRQVWVIEKSNPNKCIMKIDKSEFDLIKNGVYKSFGISINFGGKKYFVDDIFIQKLNDSVKKEIEINELTFSFREYIEPESIDNLKITYDLAPIKHLKSSNDDIYFVTSKTTEENYKNIHNKLIEKLKDNGIIVNQTYYLNSSYFAQSSDENMKKISYVVISNLLGRNIRKDELMDTNDREYTSVNYYDSNYVTINKLKLQIKEFLNNLTTKEVNKRLYLNKVTSNELNIIEREEIELYDKYIKTFESFSRHHDSLKSRRS